MKIKSGCSSLMSITVMVVTLVFCTGRSTTGDAASTFTLEQPVHFFTSDGTDLVAEPGTYSLDTLVGSRIHLKADGRAPLFLGAQTTAHNEEIEAPLAVTVSGEDPDVVHVVLLLPNGQALDVPGSISGTRSRWFSSMLVSKAQIQLAVAQQAPVVRGHRGQQKAMPPPPPLAPAQSTSPPFVRDHRPPPPSNTADFELAYHYAPIHYQDTDSTNAKADYITRYDYDGNNVSTDNCENLNRYPLTAHAYYSVIETCSH